MMGLELYQLGSCELFYSDVYNEWGRVKGEVSKVLKSGREVVQYLVYFRKSGPKFINSSAYASQAD